MEDTNFKKKISEFDNLSITGDVQSFDIEDNTSKIHLKYGMGELLEKQVYENSNQDIKIIINGSETKNLYIDYDFNEENIDLVDNIEIVANKNSKATIAIKYNSLNDLENYYHNGIIRCHIESGAKIDVIIVNMLNIKSNNFISIENTIQENAKLNYTIVDFGGMNSISNYYSNLIGNDSECNLNTIYLGKENQFFDINYIAELKGEKTKANIEVQGALKDFAKKNFKGTIDFQKGCKKAIGNENEFCMVLSDTAKSKALPMLLCTEEDVEGNHSTASGKVDKAKLFYIMSRGISYKEAMKLIVKANFSKIIENIKDENLRQNIFDEIDNKLN